MPCIAIAGSATLTWTAPTQNEDGSPYTDPSHYTIRAGCIQPGQYEEQTVGPIPYTQTSVMVSALPENRDCYFVATATNLSGVESAYSNPATKFIESTASLAGPVENLAVTWQETTEPVVSTNILVDITTTFSTSQEPDTDQVTWTDITGLTATATVAGTGSVLLMTAVVPILDTGSGNESFIARFTIDGTPYGPEMAAGTDAISEANGAQLSFAVSGISAGSHDFAVEFLEDPGTQTRPGTSTTLASSFQVIEFEENASIVVDASSKASDTPDTTYSDIVFTGSQTFTPTANALHLFLFNGTIEIGTTAHYADFQFEIGTTLEGPASMGGSNATSTIYSLAIAWARTGLAAASTDVAVRWRGVSGAAETPQLGTSYNRTFQVIEITDNFSLETNVETSTADTATASYSTMDAMDTATDTASIDSTDSVVLALAHWSQDATGDTVADSRLKLAGNLVGGEAHCFTDNTDENVGSQLFHAITGVSGSLTASLEWRDGGSGLPDTDTGRERTFQIIDFKAASGAVNLVVGDALQSMTADNVALTQALTLSVAEALMSMTADNVDLTQANTLAVAEALLSAAADNVALTQAHTLAVSDALLSMTADNVVLSTAVALAVAEALLSMTADNVDLTQANTLSVAEALMSQAADNIALTQANTLSVAGALLSQTADNVVLTTATILELAEALMSMTADNVALIQGNTLELAEALLSMTADNVVLSTAESLGVQSALMSQSADSVVLTQAHTLAVAEALMSQTVDNIALTQAHTLAINDALLSVTADTPTLSAGVTLSIAEALMSMTADSVALTQANTLSVAEAVMAMTAAGVDLTQAHTLVVDDGLFTLLADTIALGDVPISPDSYLVVSAADKRIIVAKSRTTLVVGSHSDRWH